MRRQDINTSLRPILEREADSDLGKVASARRSHLELQAEVLHAVYRGRDSPSKIVYAANLSYDRVLKYIRFLEERGLIHKKESLGQGSPRYLVTPKGIEVIQCYTRVRSALASSATLRKQT